MGGVLHIMPAMSGFKIRRRGIKHQRKMNEEPLEFDLWVKVLTQDGTKFVHCMELDMSKYDGWKKIRVREIIEEQTNQTNQQNEY
jgi:hypothetical protein